jgi:hypothetical protein
VLIAGAMEAQGNESRQHSTKRAKGGSYAQSERFLGTKIIINMEIK